MDDEEEVKGQNNPNDDRRKQLYAQSDEERQSNEDFTDVTDDAEVPAETPAEDKTEAVPQEETPEAKKYKLKVNGKDVELTEEEVLKRAELAEGANQKFEEAARIRREAEQIKQASPKAPAEPQVTDDDLALARALQMGDEKEAAAVIARLRKPSIQMDQVSRLVDERVSFQSSVEAFKEQYPDIAGDPYLWEIAQDKDAKLVAGGDTRAYYERFKAIGDDLRNWMKSKAPATETSQKLARKAAVPAPVKSGMKAQAPAEDDTDESPSEIIAKMAAKRGQGYGGNV